MKTAPPDAPPPASSRRVPRFGHFDPVLVGSFFGLVSAAIYTCSNICLRAVVGCDAYWVACMKAVPTVVVAVIMVSLRLARGRPLLLSPGALAALVATGLIGQLAGNVGFQYALQVVGLALAVPLTLGTIIVGGALLGRFWLGEPVTPRTAAAMLVLLIAVPILSFGAKSAAAAVESLPQVEVSGWLVAMGIGAACLSGLAYAFQGAVLRRMATSHTPHSVTLLALSVTGVAVLGSISLNRLGWDQLCATEPTDFIIMVWAGLFNAVGFFTLTKSLQLITVIHVNAINASQAAMAAVAGLVFFHEPATLWLALGVGLTVVGLCMIDRGKQPVGIDEV